MIFTAVFVPVIFKQARLLQPNEKRLINFLHLVLKEPLKQIQTPAAALITATLASLQTGVCRRLSGRKDSTTPCRFAILSQQVSIHIDYRPTDGSSTEIKTDVVIALNIT